MDEVRGPGDQGYDDLKAKVDNAGWSAEKAGTVVLVVNQRGEAFIHEGNTRIAVAAAKGIPALNTEVQWINGGEDVGGAASPARIAALAASCDPELDLQEENAPTP